jgi:hypothetical protein
MSNITTTNIDETFPVQGQDNNSQGFRTNFSAIKNALIVAKSEITELENITVKNNTTTNFNSNKLENIVFNNISELYKNKGIPEDQQIEIDTRDAKAFKVKCIGNTTIRLRNWPTNQPSLAKLHKILLHIQFELNENDPNLTNYKINFSTDLGGQIKSFKYNNQGAWQYELLSGGWYLRPWKDDTISNNFNNYEHVFEVWTYNTGLTVFINYIGSFV